MSIRTIWLQVVATATHCEVGDRACQYLSENKPWCEIFGPVAEDADGSHNRNPECITKGAKKMSDMLEIVNSAGSIGVMPSSTKKGKVFVVIHAERGTTYVTPVEAREFARMLIGAADAVEAMRAKCGEVVP